MAARAKNEYACGECGWSSTKWVGQCGECQQWNTMVEGSGPTRGLGTIKSIKPATIVASSAAKPITDVSTVAVASRSTRV